MGHKFKPTSLPSALIAVVCVAVILRIIYWLFVRNEAWFTDPGMDPAFYTAWADAILSGQGKDFLPFPRAPLYPYILAIIRGIFGDGWLYPRLLNLIADVFTILIIFKLTMRIHDYRTGIIATILFTISGASIYYSGEILMTPLATACAVVLIYSLIILWDRPTVPMASLSGALLAILSLLRPNALVLLPASAILTY